MRTPFRSLGTLAASLVTLSLAAPAFGQFHATLNINCTRGESLATAVGFALPNTVINVKGSCAGPISITTSGLQINAVGTAVISGGGKDGVTIAGAHGIVLSGLTISGGNNGVVAVNGGQVTLLNDSVTGNVQSGIVSEANSSVTVNGGSSKNNGFHGIDVEATSALVVTGHYGIAGNGVFGINVNNGSSLTLTGATLAVSNNTLGIQMGTNASGFLDGQSSLNSSQNFSDGLTIVSGSHMVDFGGTIATNNNFTHGISLNSKAGLDLDAGSQVTSTGNSGDGVHMEQSSVMTVFNNPLFSQVPVATQLNASFNGTSGVNLLTGSRILVDNDAELSALSNVGSGVRLDDGSALSFGHSIALLPGVTSIVQANNYPDIGLTFGSRLTYVDNESFGIVVCDASSQIRGPNAPTCPH
jgi:hypothetical protein